MAYKIQLLIICLLTSAVFPGNARQVKQDTNSDAQSAGPSKQPSYMVLYSFTGGADGGDPNGASTDAVLVRDREGNLYGTASYGGLVNNNCPSGCGVVFKIDRSGQETVLHTFGGSPDGALPGAALIMDEEGNLYGTTIAGGAKSLPAGTVFKVDRLGHESVLYSFGGSDGNSPSGSLSRDIWGNLYGTTQAGGSFCAAYGGCGVVFKLDRQGEETILHSFSGPDGEYPGSNLTWDEWGDLYGTTQAGGNSDSGVIFKIDQKGNEKVMYSFSGGADGGSPGDLIRDIHGNLYGTAAVGGYAGSGFCLFSGGCGVVFKLDKAGTYSTLYAFQGDDGWSPYGHLLLHDCDLYGTTFFGGSGGGGFGGTIFKLDSKGKETVLYNFTGGSDGGNPNAGLIEGDQGNLYGTSVYGGPTTACGIGCGVVYELQIGRLGDSESASGQSALPAAPRNHPSYQRKPLFGSDKAGPWVAKP